MKQVEYLPPAPEVITRLARRACAELAQRDAGFSDPIVAQGFSVFLAALAQAAVHNLNRRSRGG